MKKKKAAIAFDVLSGDHTSSMSQVAQLEDVLMEEAPPPRARQRKTSKIFIEAFGGTCQVAPDYRRVSSQP